MAWKVVWNAFLGTIIFIDVLATTYLDGMTKSKIDECSEPSRKSQTGEYRGWFELELFTLDIYFTNFSLPKEN